MKKGKVPKFVTAADFRPKHGRNALSFGSLYTDESIHVDEMWINGGDWKKHDAMSGVRVTRGEGRDGNS